MSPRTTKTSKPKPGKARARGRVGRKRQKRVRLTAFDAARYFNSDAAVAAFIDEALATGKTAVLMQALDTVARARGMSVIAEQTGLGRESLYKALVPTAHPRFETILAVTQALGVQLRATAARGHSH